MELALDIIALATMAGSGIYALYTYFYLRRNWGFFPNKFLMPTNCPPEECLDEDGFLEYISVRLLIFGILCSTLGVLYIPLMLSSVADFLHITGTVYEVLGYAVPFLGVAVFIWFMACQARSARKFWN